MAKTGTQSCPLAFDMTSCQQRSRPGINSAGANYKEKFMKWLYLTVHLNKGPSKVPCTVTCRPEDKFVEKMMQKWLL